MSGRAEIVFKCLDDSTYIDREREDSDALCRGHTYSQTYKFSCSVSLIQQCMQLYADPDCRHGRRRRYARVRCGVTVCRCTASRYRFSQVLHQPSHERFLRSTYDFLTLWDVRIWTPHDGVCGTACAGQKLSWSRFQAVNSGRTGSVLHEVFSG
jgi:hypothetical protein